MKITQPDIITDRNCVFFYYLRIFYFERWT